MKQVVYSNKRKHVTHCWQQHVQQKKVFLSFPNHSQVNSIQKKSIKSAKQYLCFNSLTACIHHSLQITNSGSSRWLKMGTLKMTFAVNIIWKTKIDPEY